MFRYVDSKDEDLLVCSTSIFGYLIQRFCPDTFISDSKNDIIKYRYLTNQNKNILKWFLEL
jgi:hypothetical protein